MDTPKIGKYGRKKRPSSARKRCFLGNKRPVKVLIVEEQQQQQETTENIAEHMVVVDNDNTENIVAVVDNEDNNVTPVTRSASAKKLKPILVEVQAESDECNIIMNSKLFIDFVNKLSRCPECGDNINNS